MAATEPRIVCLVPSITELLCDLGLSRAGGVAALVPGAEVSLIDGEMTSWYWSQAIVGLDYLVEYSR